MERLSKKTKFRWIGQGTRELEKNSVVVNFIPEKYTHFCKIMNPIYRDLNIKDESLFWSECDPIQEVIMDNLEQMTFKEVFHDLNLTYTKEISAWSIYHGLGMKALPRYLISPEEGTMEYDVLEETVKILKTFSNERDCYFYYDDLKLVNSFPVSTEEHDFYRLYFGNLNDVLSLYQAGDKGLGSPTYWWPEDKQWCIYTDFDLDFSIVGGSKEIIEAFVSNEKLECIQVERH